MPYLPCNICLPSLVSHILPGYLRHLPYSSFLSPPIPPVLSVYLPILPYTTRLFTLFPIYYLCICNILSSLSVYISFRPTLSAYPPYLASTICLSTPFPYAIRLAALFPPYPVCLSTRAPSRPRHCPDREIGGDRQIRQANR